MQFSPFPPWGLRREASAKAYRSAYPLGRLLVGVPSLGKPEQVPTASLAERATSRDHRAWADHIRQ